MKVVAGKRLHHNEAVGGWAEGAEVAPPCRVLLIAQNNAAVAAAGRVHAVKLIYVIVVELVGHGVFLHYFAPVYGLKVRC